MVRLRSPAPNGGFPERPKGADCKSVVTDFGGPNPPSPTKKDQRHLPLVFFAFECHDEDHLQPLAVVFACAAGETRKNWTLAQAGSRIHHPPPEKALAKASAFSVKSAFGGINPLAWMKSLRDEILLCKAKKADLISSEAAG